jgi:hypothetical protein
MVPTFTKMGPPGKAKALISFCGMDVELVLARSIAQDYGAQFLSDLPDVLV